MRKQNEKTSGNDKLTPTESCDLCGLRLPKNPPTLNHNNEVLYFCCSGCRHVFTLLAESGLLEGDFRTSELYQNFLKLGIIGNPEKDVTSEKPASVDLENAAELDLHIDGMWCSSCSWLIEKTMQSEQGVVDAKIIYASDTAKIYYSPEKVSPKQLMGAIDKLGYKASSREDAADVHAAERTSLLLKMGVALFLWMNIMFFSYVLYVGYFQELSAEITRIVPIILLGLTLPVTFWCGYPIHKKAYSSLKGLAPTMELLISISVFSAFFYSIYALLSGHDHFYFDTASSLVALVLVGKFVEFNAKNKTAQNIHRLYEVLPQKVRLKTPAGERLVSVKKLQVGDHFFVKSGEKIPTDGVIVAGSATIDESLLSGESRPVEKNVGDLVTGSTMNNSGTIEVQTLCIGEETVFAGIIKMVENALSTKSPLEESVDKVSRVFIPIVLIIASLTALFLFNSGLGLEKTLLRSITVLVIACPCALGMATPLAVAAGIGYAAKLGILIKDGAVLQTARKLKTLVFDKTGTITEGKFVLQKMNHSGPEQIDYLNLIAAVEQYSNHPIGEAIVADCQNKGIALLPAEGIELREGAGILGNVKTAGQNYRVVIGTTDWLAEQSFLPGKLFQKETESEAEQGRTIVYFGLENIKGEDDGCKKITGYLSLGDTLKPKIRETVEKLENTGIKVRLLSGDNESTTRTIAGQAGIGAYHATALPDEKIKIISELQSRGNVVGMVGDGVNDAPALARADLGMAVGGGTRIAIESAPITLLRDDVQLVNEAIDISRRTVNTISQNLVWAFLYNSIGIIVAIAGYLNPLIAASAMLVSSLSVVGNSLRLKEGRGKTAEKLLEFLIPWREVAETPAEK